MGEATGEHSAGEPAQALGPRLAQLVRPIVWCQASDRIREVAQQVSARAGSCALVRTDAGLGIVTDHDFRQRVATGEVDLDAPVAAVTTVPVLTIAQEATQAAGLLRMVEHGVHHLIVTDQTGRPAGVVRAVDLAQVEVRDPLRIRSAIEAATTLDALAEAAELLPATLVQLRDNEVAAPHIGALHAAVLDAIIRRALQLHPEPVLAEVRHSWVVLGSLARREPLPLSDLDTALVWEDPPEAAAADLAPEIRAAAGRVLANLRRCGLVPCPEGTSADQPRFSRSRAAWTAALRGWQHDPTPGQALLMSAMVADSRPLTTPTLASCLTEPVRTRTRNTRFLRALLEEALSFRPPTGFVRDFVVEHGGQHRGQLDLKRRGLAPVVALARWVGIVTGETGGGTLERLRRGAAQGVLTADEGRALAGAFEDIYALLLDQEVAALRSGVEPTAFVAPRELDSLTRRHLRESFRVVRGAQARIDAHWLARLETSVPPGRR